MRLFFFFSLFILIQSTCTKTQIEYNGECLSSCQDVNLFYDSQAKSCVSNCKSLDYFRYNYNCQPTCTKTKSINSNNLDNFCLTSSSYCEIFGKRDLSGYCYDTCKLAGAFVSKTTPGSCTSSCTNYVYEDGKESYCMSSCLNFGLRNNNPCTKNCKAIGKFYYNRECRSACTNLKEFYTEEENYCIQSCEYYNMEKIQGSNTCTETCKSVGQILGSDMCYLKNSYYKLTYEDEDYDVRYCSDYGMVIGPSSTCVNKCKEIGKVRYSNTCYSSCYYDNSATQVYPYEYENEIYCLNKQQCNNIGKYANKKNGLYYCNDECDGTDCFSDCPNNQYYSISSKECVYSCREEGLFLYDKYCINSCPIFANKIYNGPSEDICVKECPESAPYFDTASYKCLESCSSLYIFDNKCVNTCPRVALYVNIVDENKFCVKNCKTLGLYNLISEKQCTNNCKKNSQYLFEGNCFKSCISEAPYIYLAEDENICTNDCSKYGLLFDIDNIKCVNNCKSIGKIRYENRCISQCPFNVKFKYSTSEEDYCVEDCVSYGQKNVGLICTEETCKSQGKALFNDICTSCLEGFTFKIVGDNEDFCTLECGDWGLIPNYKTSKCESKYMSCSGGTFKDVLNNNCVNKCPNDRPYIKDSFCVKNCENFFYEDNNGNKYCVDSCSGNYKYMIINQGKCVSSCSNMNNYQLNGYNICYSNCNEQSIIQRYHRFTKNIFSSCVQTCLNNDNTKTENDCSNNCLKPFKFKLNNNSDKKCYQSCQELNKYEYIDNTGNNLCVNNCKELNKVLYKNKCVNKCPKEMKIKSEQNNDIICVDSCPSNQYLNYDEINNEYICVDNCKDINLVLDNNKCVNICPKERSIIVYETNENKCSDSCGNNKYINNLKNNKKECIESCNAINKYINGNSCVDECPSFKNFKINKNNEIFCSLSCDDEYKYINEENNNKFCVKNCYSIGKKLYDGNCVKECPSSKNIEIEKNNEIECSAECGENKYILSQDNKNICVTSCETYNKFLNDGKCISECPEGKYLYEELSQNKKYCIDDCSIHNLYINDNKCVKDCIIFNKKILNGECLKECPNDYPYSKDNICRKDPCEEGEFYDAFNKKCLSKCDSLNNYQNIDNDFCINSCININSNKIYSIQNNLCINNCTQQNKYLYFYENDYYCLDNCENNDLLISEDGKYCVENCNENTQYLNEQLNQCVNTCNDLLISDNKCVEKCPDSKPYIYNHQCINSCYDNFLYKIYNTNICVDKCSTGLILNSENKPFYFMDNYKKCLEDNNNNNCENPFYLTDRENRICYQNCEQSENTKYLFKSEECVGYCIYGIKDKDNFICNDKEENNSINEGSNNNCDTTSNTNDNYNNNNNGNVNTDRSRGDNEESYLHFKYLLIFILIFL